MDSSNIAKVLYLDATIILTCMVTSNGSKIALLSFAFWLSLSLIYD